MSTLITGPIAKSKAEQVREGIHAGRLRPEISDLVDRFEQHDRETEDNRASLFVQAEKDRRQAAMDAVFRTDVEAQRQAAYAAAIKPFETEEAALRARATQAEYRPPNVTDAEWKAELRADSRRLFFQAHAGTLATQIANALTVDDVRGIFEDAQITGHDDIIRTAGTAAKRRLHELAVADKEQPTSPNQVAYLTFVGEFQKWSAAHPTASERLRQIQRERANIAILLEASVNHVFRLYGLPTSDRLQVGPAFDSMWPGGKNE